MIVEIQPSVGSEVEAEDFKSTRHVKANLDFGNLHLAFTLLLLLLLLFIDVLFFVNSFFPILFQHRHVVGTVDLQLLIEKADGLLF